MTAESAKEESGEKPKESSDANTVETSDKNGEAGEGGKQMDETPSKRVQEARAYNNRDRRYNNDRNKKDFKKNIKSDFSSQKETDDPVQIRKQVGFPDSCLSIFHMKRRMMLIGMCAGGILLFRLQPSNRRLSLQTCRRSRQQPRSLDHNPLFQADATLSALLCRNLRSQRLFNPRHHRTGSSSLFHRARCRLLVKGPRFNNNLDHHHHDEPFNPILYPRRPKSPHPTENPSPRLHRQQIPPGNRPCPRRRNHVPQHLRQRLRSRGTKHTIRH